MRPAVEEEEERVSALPKDATPSLPSHEDAADTELGPTHPYSSADGRATTGDFKKLFQWYREATSS